MLKKTGIAVAAATAGLLAFSPLAFAGGVDGPPAHQGPPGHSKKGGDVTQTGLVNLNDTTVQANLCGNNVDVIGVSDVTAALGLLAPATVDKVVKCKNEND